MMDRSTRDELEGVLSLGRLADRMVFALGRAIRGEALDVSDLPLLERAKQLFELMASEDVIVVDHHHDRMLNDASYLDALQVVELSLEGADVEDFAQRLVTLLNQVVAGNVTDNEREALVALRELFSEVGEATLARAGELSRPRQETSWQLMRPATSRF